jgi:hypothetical protein
MLTKFMTSVSHPNSFKGNNNLMHLDMQAIAAMVGKA